MITNDFGRYSFLTPFQLKDLLLNNKRLDDKTDKYLCERYFTYSGDIVDFSSGSSFEMLSIKSYLYKSTSLHIFVLTSACNQKCVYCQAHSDTNRPIGFMSKETAKKAVDIAIQSPTEYLDFEFQGGEPLLNFEVLKYIVDYATSVCNKHINFSLVTNLTLLTDEIINFIVSHNISVSTSLDGNPSVHNTNRPYQDGGDTYSCVAESIKRLRENNIYVSAIQTTTRASLPYYKEVVDAYIDLGFHSIFIRPLTPLGCAKEHWKDIGYSALEFTAFYRNILSYIVSKNCDGYYLDEGHAKIFLTKLLSGSSPNYMELRSPCGAALGQLAYYYDGNVFTCDEARMLFEMGDGSFCVGNVNCSDYNSIIDSKISALVSKSSVLESLPSCSDCVYQPYCGVCPVINYAVNNSVYENAPHEYRCRIYSGMLDSIFDYFYYNDKAITDVFWSWIE